MSPASIGYTTMGILPCVAGAAEVGLSADAARDFNLYLTGGTLKPPFDVQTETADNDVGPFLTGEGAYLQSLIYAFTGLQIRAAGLVDAYPPMLPSGWRSLTLENVWFRGRRYDVVVARNAAGKVQLRRFPAHERGAL
jgi:trehalose/maltose hydrolase-like predicted phosphorylase